MCVLKCYICWFVHRKKFIKLLLRRYVKYIIVILLLLVCVCVCVRARARARVYIRERERACVRACVYLPFRKIQTIHWKTLANKDSFADFVLHCSNYVADKSTIFHDVNVADQAGRPAPTSTSFPKRQLATGVILMILPLFQLNDLTDSPFGTLTAWEPLPPNNPAIWERWVGDQGWWWWGGVGLGGGERVGGGAKDNIPGLVVLIVKGTAEVRVGRESLPCVAVVGGSSRFIFHAKYTVYTRTFHAKYTMYTRTFHAKYTMYTRTFHAKYTMYTRAFHAKYTVYTRTFHAKYTMYTRTFHAKYTMYTRTFHAKYTMYTRTFHAKYTMYTRTFHAKW